MARRRKARELVFAVLYQLEHGQDAALEALETLAAQRKPGAEVLGYARQLLAGILERGPELDRLIEGSLEHWSLRRLAATDRTVLRLAAGELLVSPDTPAVVVINEAVDLAGRYGTAESGAFVNGVLDRIARGLRPEEMRGLLGAS